MTTFLETLESMPTLLANGGVMARIMARSDIELDSHVVHAAAVFDERARAEARPGIPVSLGPVRVHPARRS